MEFEPAYLIHVRPYQNTSALADFFTLNYGRIHSVVRGAYRLKNPARGILQPFIPLFIRWIGKKELVTLTHIEQKAKKFDLKGEIIWWGFYVNELLSYLLNGHTPHEDLFWAYESLLSSLMQSPHQLTLRLFEKRLLQMLGYAISFKQEYKTEDPIQPQAQYHFLPGQGFHRLNYNKNFDVDVFSGESLLALANENLENEKVLRDAKRLMRLAIDWMLNGKPIKTREFFYASKK